MTFPSPSHSAKSSIASGTAKPSASRPVRSQQSPWGTAASQNPIRRGLTPLATNISSSTSGSPSRRPPQSHSPAPSASATSPLTSSFSAVLSSTSRFAVGRNNPSPASTPASFAALQAGAQQQHQQQSGQSLTSPKFRALTPSSASHLATSATSSTGGGGSGGGGGGGGGSGVSRGATFSPRLTGVNSPTGFASDKPNSASAASAVGSSQSSLSKISVAQVFLLLDSINEKEGKEKWETKAAQIHKLVGSNGMEVFSKYFRRLLSGNAPQIFPGTNKVVENAGNYPLLVQEMQKVSQDMDQARKIAETIDTSEGDIFRDFDLSTFVDHFKLDPISKVALILAFKSVSRADLRTKADAILSTSVPQFFQSLSAVSDSNKDFSSSFIGLTIERFIFNPPRNLNDDLKRKLIYAARMRYQVSDADVPAEIEAALQMFAFSDPRLTLLRQIQGRGPRSFASKDAVLDAITASGPDAYNEEQIANAILFMIYSQNWQQSSPELLVATVQQNQATHPISWRRIVQFFDKEGLRINARQFIRLFNALLPVAHDDPHFDIQCLWGGEWENKDVQFSFVTAFLSSNIDTSNIPSFRSTFSIDIFDDASEMVRQQAESIQNNPLRSLDAVKAIFDLILLTPGTWALPESQAFVKTILQHDLPTFLCSAFAIPQPWTNVQINFVIRSFMIFVSKRQEGYQFALHGVWKLGRQWVGDQLFHAFTQDPSCTDLIYEHAVEHGWLDYLLGFTTGLAMDLASLAHRKDSFDLEQWVKSAAQKTPVDMGGLLSKFLRIKAEDELRVRHKEQAAPQMVSLAVKTVYALLLILEDYITDHENLTPIQRICLQAYPRLINYGEGLDDIIEANGTNGNAIPDEVEKQMQDLFGKMYHEELSLREILELMRRYKSSRDPGEQDLFTCMVHGLIDEYHCYHEYPLEALSKTAVMFGGIINFKLISGIPLKVGLGMILDAVRDHESHESMYKFGVEAIEQLVSRLPEWPGFCGLLLQVPSLQGTAIYRKAEDVLRAQGHRLNDTDRDVNGLADGLALANGTVDDLVGADSTHRNFRSLHVDPPLRPDIYREPEEDVHDKILFILNNVSEQNIHAKLKDLQDVLRDQHHQWFASYIVEQRAKVQPNFQQLYLELLGLIDDKTLWAEVLRETYVSAIRLLNAESTLNSSTDRAHLKNLGGWLGSLTIATDKPIKHKNIYFKDLLIEAFDTQRLTVVIPFTCKVLGQAMKSTIFKPPNPWLMDIIALLMEIYHFAEIKMILKFEIEVLCGDLQLDHKTIEPSTCIRERPPQLEDGLVATSIAEGLEGFDEMSLAGLNRASRNERISPAAIISSLPNLDQILVYPPSANAVIDPNVLRQIVHTAVERAIAEIIAPVVERSITIASISTAQLILKDFAMEPDEEKVRQAAGAMVRALAGSLAVVTCKEPLKINMTNYIRMIQQEYSEQPMPEGLILMCVNDNLDAACGIVEKAAEERSLPEIEKVIESQLEARRRHRIARSNEPYIDPSISRWGFFIPEPYRQVPGGLNKEQLAIYEEFARQSRGQNHIQNTSTDSIKQLPDVLQEGFPAIPNLSTPAEQPALPHQMTQAQQDAGVQQQTIANAQPQLNGFLQSANPREKVEKLVGDLQQAARDAPEDHIKDLWRDSPILQEYNQILRAILSSPNGEELARLTATKICSTLYTQTEKPLEIEVLVHLLSKICELSSLVARYTWAVLAEVEDGQMFNVPVTVALIDAGLIDLHRVDLILAKLIKEKNVAALELLAALMARVLFNDEPSALRSDFSGSLAAMNQWLIEDPNLNVAKDIIQKLHETGIPESVNAFLTDQARSTRDQMEYIFSEWIGVYKFAGANDKMYSTFLKDMHQRQVMNNQEDSALFFRLSIDISVAMFEHEYQNLGGNLDEAFLYIDALAKLVVLLVKFQGDGDGAVKKSKPSYLNSILSLLVLVLNHHQVMRGDNFNQRVFFRLFSGILCEYAMSGLQQREEHKEMMRVFSDKFLSLQPKHCPGFVYGWLSLISHRVFMAGMLTMEDQSGWEPFCEIVQVMLSYTGEQLKPGNISFVAKDLYKGVLRILLILHHDFPEFVAENHFRFCTVMPAHCSQLRNLVLSAYPSSFQKLPDPFRDGLKVDRLDEIHQAPRIAGDIVAPLQAANIKNAVDNALRSFSATDSAVQQICDAVDNPSEKSTGLYFAPINVDIVLLEALVLYTGQSAVSATGQKAGTPAPNNLPQSALLEKLVKVLNPEGRYYFLSSIANQLRYPNSHTHYFSNVMLELFGSYPADQQGTDIREQIIRVLLERLIVHRPHPWGLIITLQELLQNSSYPFFRLPFIQAAPEIGRLFEALLQHIQQQSPRPSS
ncbi:general negative regulator of transcription subunit 1 [Coccidioides immitis RMSCC 2394]|nr:general negative regulator of transcription subunit 1 [Coccidioides immitis RMSCC 2394]